MPSDLDAFIRQLVKSRLLSLEEVRGFCGTYPPANRPQSAMALARELVAHGLLTPYQASCVSAGNGERLVLGNIVILDKIAEGGMGEVFRAEHRHMKRIVAVKILPEFATRNATLLQRFHREVQTAGRLVHRNIVTAFDAGEQDGVYFLVMEYVDGEDLGTLIDRLGPLPVETAVSYTIQAARGLQFAHAQGVVHRDIKPANLLVDRHGVVKILDMGLARILEGDERPEVGDSLTDHRNIIGTVEYMSPEQADDSSIVDHRADIYSLGCTLYRMLTGVPPFRRRSPLKTLMAHRTAPIPPLCAQRSDIPEALDLVYRRMVAKSPSERFASMDAVVSALTSILDESDFEAGPMLVPRSSTNEITGPGAFDGPDGMTVMLDKDTTSSSGLKASRVGSLPSTMMAVGVNLGTTYSSIAWLDELGRPQTLPNSEGESITPSMVFVEADEVLVGREANKAMVTDIDAVAVSPKRDLGARFYGHALRGKRYPPEVLQAWILRKLCQDAKRHIGEFQRVVLTVPAYFDEARRKSTQDIGYIAGMHVIDIINEPTAAALAFAYGHGYFDDAADPERRVNVLIYDLGGGTFDVTVMEISRREFRTLATDGDAQLGGWDWDQRLVDHVASRFVREFGDDPRHDLASRKQLWKNCEAAKCSLSTRKRATIVCHHNGKQLNVAVSRQQFERMTEDLLQRTAFTTLHALDASGLGWKDISHVILVGGSTRMPAVRDLLRRLSGREPDSSISPDEAVAQGAALHARLVMARHNGSPPPLRVTNVNAHSLGVVATHRDTRQDQVAVLIPRNTPLPAMARRMFLTTKRGQQSIRIEIVEGESGDPAECTPVGKCVIRNLPEDLPLHSPIDVRFRYEENGRLTVSVLVPHIQRRTRVEVLRENGLSDEELDAWRKVVSGESPDRTALRGAMMEASPT